MKNLKLQKISFCIKIRSNNNSKYVVINFSDYYNGTVYFAVDTLQRQDILWQSAFYHFTRKGHLQQRKVCYTKWKVPLDGNETLILKFKKILIS